MAANASPILFNKITGPFGCMSNFSAHKVVVEGLVYPTSEHFFQAMKFIGSPTAMEEIRAMKSPMTAAMGGRSRSRPLRRDWDHVKDDVMEAVLLMKFTQHADLYQLLISTHDRQLVEHTARDKYWGDGGDGGNGTIGLNRLGGLLMKVRTFFMSAEGSTPQKVNAKIDELLLNVRPRGNAPQAAGDDTSKRTRGE